MDIPYMSEIFAAAVGLAGALGGWHAARTKTRAEATASAEDDDIERERLADTRLRTLLDAQRADFEAVISPIREDVESLRREVRELHAALDALRARYRAAIDYVRELLRWARSRPDADAAPPVPPVLADEV
ncbi:hypothetical protein IU433_13975 [Nocardia puris]|uniref:hypothetical protein n=1 Tax=Nocardia puris TaxID=208602 RepID=UPI001895085D|nr:hypothetical protein [Nocardia puris]MBF6460144.1 hypothetical protein [Nocardia puris]